MRTPSIAIVGAGHAGVEAAFALAKEGCKVTLFSDEPCLPYFRPRLIAVAFGQADPEAIAIKPRKAYDDAAIDLRHEAVAAVDAAARTVNGALYDGIVLATGSRPFVPPFGREGGEQSPRTLWTMADALALRAVCAPGKALAVIGGGVLGLEAALRAAEAGLRVTVVEAAPALVGGALGPGEATLHAAFEAKGIALRVGVGVSAIVPEGVVLADGGVVAGNVTLCSAGARPNGALAGVEGFVRTRPDLSVAPGVFCAGDPAQPTEARPVCAVRRAQLMGQLAARNLLAGLAGRPAEPWADPALPLFMKVGDVEFHTLGDVRSPGLEERREDDGADPRVWKSVLYRAGAPVGLRWVGTRAGFGDWEKRLARA